MSDNVIEEVIQTIKKSEQSAIQKQQTIRQLDMLIDSTRDRVVNIDKEIANAKEQLGIVGSEIISKQADNKCFQLRLESNKVQWDKMDRRIAEEEEKIFTKICGVGNVVDQIVADVARYASRHGTIGKPEENSSDLKERRNKLMHTLLNVEAAHAKLNILKAVVGNKKELEKQLGEAKQILDSALNKKQSLETEARNLMEKIHNENNQTKALDEEIRNLQSELTAMVGNSGGSVDRQLLAVRYGQKGTTQLPQM